METTRKAALAKGETQYFTGAACVKGHVAPRRAKTGECMTCRAEKLVVWRKNNPDKVKAHNTSQYAKNAEKTKANARAWEKKNPTKVLAKTRLMQAKKRQRCPHWLTSDDRWMLRQAYELAALRTKMLGVPFEVDHIVPLQGKNVSGLHVPENIQVIPAVANRAKSNRFEVAL
jgi:hypothetical protein